MDKTKKKQLKRTITWIALAALVALLAVMPLLAQSEQEAEGPVASILSGTVQMGSIETGLRGGGTLAYGNTVEVTLPAGVKITEFLVRNNQQVAKGAPVAVVDTVSVMTAVQGVRETLDYLQEEMDAAENETAASTIRATAGGLVKQVFAQKGDRVEDVMLRHGALAVLSLDGLMAVELEGTGFGAGDPMTVTFPDGAQVPGRVESCLDGTLVVTVTDDAYPVGTRVSVSEPQGDPIGAGELYVHNAWRAMAFQGTVTSVYARENRELSDGAALFSLTDTDFTGTREALASLHRDYTELLQKLFELYETGLVTAPCDGVVSGVDQDSPLLLAAIHGEEGWFPELLDAPKEETGWTVMLLGNVQSICTGEADCDAEPHSTGCRSQCSKDSLCLNPAGNDHHQESCPLRCTGGTACQSPWAQPDHELACQKRCISDRDEDPVTTCDAQVHYDACIENCAKSDACTALNHKEGCYYHGVTYTARAAQVALAAIDGLKVIPGQTTYQVEPQGGTWKLVSPETIQDVFADPPQDLTVSDPSQYSQGDILLIVSYTNSSGEVIEQKIVRYSQSTPSGGWPGGLPSFNFGGLFSGMGGLGGMMGGYGTQSSFELFDLEEQTLMTVTEQQTMTLSILLDEHDIARAALGQEARVKITPLKNRSFEAQVTDIGSQGSNNGGSSKFTVELSLPMEADMIAGMSATAYIPLYTKMNVLTIPVAALAEEAGRTVVYTARDEKTGELTAPVEVTLGVSDGTVAEVLSGLQSGDAYFYSYYDTLELSNEVETERFTFGG